MGFSEPFFLHNKWVQSKPLRRERQTNKWICLRTRCVSCGFSSGFSGILVLGIMILEAVTGGEGQNRRVKVGAWCCSILTAFVGGAGSRGNPFVLFWLCRWSICWRGNSLQLLLWHVYLCCCWTFSCSFSSGNIDPRFWSGFRYKALGRAVGQVPPVLWFPLLPWLF